MVAAGAGRPRMTPATSRNRGHPSPRPGSASASLIGRFRRVPAVELFDRLDTVLNDSVIDPATQTWWMLRAARPRLLDRKDHRTEFDGQRRTDPLELT